ncbi:MAG: Unknown protein [uncultured Thiotrichaceae bacterium]|uniref:Histidine kinase n=1 Tax=uncultured Thiotrichaceae bacterium TaxID=298394 RepID=A0A6S6ST70_9GAMM|nr:MAG: Unknown protein [uncultured Thiotrichaceae bacterium]
MKNSKKILTAAIGAALLSTATIIPTASAEVAASVTVANKYLWRGLDLGAGDAAVSGDLTVSNASGAYAGIWGSSGDAALGSEYDLYAGWGGKVGAIDLDVSVWSYNYPSSDIDPGEATDLVVSVGANGFNGTLYEAVQGDDDNDYRYVTLGYEMGKYSGMLGIHDFENTDGNPTHLQLGYNYNDNVSFAVSSFVSDDDSAAGIAAGADSDPQFLVSYSLDIK